MKREEVPGISCADPLCPNYEFDETVAGIKGWQVVEDQLFCPDHGHLAARQAARAKARANLEEQVAAKHAAHSDRAARSSMTTSEYEAWHDFQQEIKDYRREHGKPAPKQVLALGPRDWLRLHRSGRNINVEQEAEKAEQAKKVHQAAVERFARGV